MAEAFYGRRQTVENLRQRWGSEGVEPALYGHQRRRAPRGPSVNWGTGLPAVSGLPP
ncbi:MAG: hypothetical protein ACFCVD_16935 [Nodosilinea sp.]